ncbi:hypothetical protein NDU88_011685 [Pleurodeles waltl]|uniref:Uncharacterized protein n=1 Tax=Pleurodeles waltl TaxID=8319 RepID=A0AAV7R3T9_PLEWA|nr:hypothetical protein NDU88_011685 [Pleurodeles waltl]
MGGVCGQDGGRIRRTLNEHFAGPALYPAKSEASKLLVCHPIDTAHSGNRHRPRSLKQTPKATGGAPEKGLVRGAKCPLGVQARGVVADVPGGRNEDQGSDQDVWLK